MENPEIIIINPGRSAYQDILISIASKYGCFSVRALTRMSDNPRPARNNVVLIFFICDQKLPGGICSAFKNIARQYELVPKIAVFPNGQACHSCIETVNKLWGLLQAPFKDKEVEFFLNKVVVQDKYVDEHFIERNLRNQAKSEFIIGSSEAINQIKEKISQIASFDVNVMLTGESGTGKELCARMIHFLSGRFNKDFVPLNCGAIPFELFENELFGHKKGAYTHADSTERGLISAAEGGTLFLDEVESLPEAAQVKLLRFLEEKAYKPLGQSRYIQADVRIISAAKENLAGLIAEGRFREDLFYRLNVVEINLPPLRERREDIPLLAAYFLRRFIALHNLHIKGIKKEALYRLLEYNWPGNIRELENIIQQAAITATDQWILPKDIQLGRKDDETTFSFEPFGPAKQRAIEKFEQNYIRKILRTFQGNIKRASQFAQKDRRAFYKLLEKHRIDPTNYRRR